MKLESSRGSHLKESPKYRLVASLSQTIMEPRNFGAWKVGSLLLVAVFDTSSPFPPGFAPVWELFPELPAPSSAFGVSISFFTAQSLVFHLSAVGSRSLRAKNSKVTFSSETKCNSKTGTYLKCQLQKDWSKLWIGRKSGLNV